MKEVKAINNLSSWDEHIDIKYGVVGTKTREKYQQEFETFKLEVVLEVPKNRKNLK